MATLGKIDEYCAATEDWPQYVERLEFFLIANKVTEADMKRATLLSVIGPRTFKLLRNLLTPDKPGDKSYADLVKVLTDHFSPKPSEIVQRSEVLQLFKETKRINISICGRTACVGRTLQFRFYIRRHDSG